MNPPGTTLRRAAFLDRDGVINMDRGYVYREEDFEFVPGALEAARRLHEAGYLLVITSNQSGIGRGLYSEGGFATLTAWMKQRFLESGAPLAGVYYCPHHPTEAVGIYRRECSCRKPAPGMLLTAAREVGIDLASSIMFGDKLSDLEAARAAGVPVRVLLGTDARTLPAMPATPGLAGAAYRGLIDATAAAALLAPPGSVTAAAG